MVASISRNHDGVARLEDKLVYPSPSRFPANPRRYSRTHNPPSSPGDSRHVRGSASAISSRIKTRSYDEGDGGRGRRWQNPKETTEKRTRRKQKLQVRGNEIAAGYNSRETRPHSISLRTHPERPRRVSGGG